MPGKVKVKIISGRNLPVMDRSSDTTDAYVEVKLGTTTYKTDVCRKTLHPHWNSEWYRFEVDDSELQDEPLQVRIMDHDTYSANDAIGKVYVDLNPLLLPVSSLRDVAHDPSSNTSMSGWIPVYDTMHGIRGEVNIAIKVELFSDFNRFRQSSCGVQFFYSKSIPHGYSTIAVHGLVEELVVNDDPEYQWIDKIRTPRASNEARQTLFFKLSGELRRKIGVKAIDLGGNAVIGYCQCFDLEGESGIVARGIGTAVTLSKQADGPPGVWTEPDEERVQNLYPSSATAKFYLYKSPFNMLQDSSTDRELRYVPLFSRSNPSLINHVYRNPSVRTLLEAEEMRGTPGSGIGQKIKNFKYSSQNLLSKKMTALKARLGDKEFDSAQPVQYVDKRKKMFSKRTVSDSSMMAEILARSVIQAHTSLQCILENQSLSESPSDTLDELKPIADLLENEETQSLLERSDSSSFSESSMSDDDDDSNKKLETFDFDTVSAIIKNCAILEEHNNQGRIARQLSLPIMPYSTSDNSDLVVGDLFQDDYDSDADESCCYRENAEIPMAEPESDHESTAQASIDTIMPHKKVDVDIKHKGLVRTAMQTILLDKANIMGSFTPPSSPSCLDKGRTFDKNIFPQKISALSLDDIPDAADGNIAHPVCLSDTELATNKSDREVNVVRKRFPSFLRLSKSKPKSQLKKVKSDELHNKKSRLSFMKRNKCGDAPQKRKSQSLMHNKEEQECDKLKKHGLVGAALGNVLMETVQDILATSTSKEDKPKSQPFFPSSMILPDDSKRVNVDNTIKYPRSESNVCHINNMHASLIPPNRNVASPIPDCPHIETIDQEVQINSKMIQSPAKLNSVPCIYRRSSDSDLSITPKGNSLTGSGIALNGQMLKSTALMRSTVPQENYEMLEYPFITMTKYPPGCVLQIGGAVFARSVKLLERISNLEEPESRDIWWSEIRMEIRSHARSLNCNAILGYSESTSICEDVCVLSASGTAAVSNFHYSGDAGDILNEMTPGPKRKDTLVSPLERNEIDKDRIQKIDIKMKPLTESNENDSPTNGSSTSCSICHLPYNTNNIPVRTTVLKCSTCRVGKVPDVIIATIEVPENLSIVGRACFVQSFVCRQLKDLRGESNAKEISDGLPFLEYELHRLLVNKLKIKGMNAIFGLQIRISIGEKMLVASATGTAVFVPALPKPQLPKLVSDRNSDEKKLFDLQKHLNDTVKRNREIYHLGQTDDYNTTRIMTDEPEEEQPPTAIDLTVGNKDCCLLEVDDPEDADVLNIIMEERPPDGFHVVNTEFLPGLEDLDIVKNLQMFTQIYRARFLPPYNFDVHFRRLLQSVYFKLRRMVPCALCNLQCRIDLPETDEIQLCLLGIALALEDPQKIKGRKRNVPVKIEEDEMIFNLEEDQINENFSSTLQTQSFKNRHKLPLTRVQRLYNRERHGVDMTPLSYIPGAKVEQYLGNFNFFFIRETTSIREEGGLSGFVHSFLTEVLAIVRAHVTALGGNALIAYFMRECVLNHNLHKNQGQCLINVGGDVVFVTYNSDE